MPEQTSPFGDDFPCCTTPAVRAELSREHLDVFTFDPHAAAESEVKAMARELLAARARIAELEAQRDRVTNLFEAWAAEENEHRLAGEHGLAEGLHVAIEMLRLAVHGTYAPSYPPGDGHTHPRTPKGTR